MIKMSTSHTEALRLNFSPQILILIWQQFRPGILQVTRVIFLSPTEKTWTETISSRFGPRLIWPLQAFCRVKSRWVNPLCFSKRGKKEGREGGRREGWRGQEWREREEARERGKRQKQTEHLGYGNHIDLM